MVRRVPSKQRNTLAQARRDPGALTRLVCLLVCGLVLASGFVYAGVQHFGALKFGYETQKLRSIRDQLAGEQRRLITERETASTPGRLERAARQLGLQPLQAAQIDSLRPAAIGLKKLDPPEAIAAVSNRSQKPAAPSLKRESKEEVKRNRSQVKP